ncbi:riboflavin biosynthesis protein RibF [bacterium]|nr:riboflavin biosynthesis protein RibF [bacterium]
MEIIRELREIPNLSLALGFFDGVHIGHQEVISCAVRAAEKLGCQSAVLTFREHPSYHLTGESPNYILTLEDKYKYLEELGVDYVIELDFPSVRNLTPAEYLEGIIIKYFSPRFISTGFNHEFGVGKSGNVKFLSDYQDKYAYAYSATPPQSIWGDVVSSSEIRRFIKTGVVDMASSMLGRKFSVRGTVIKGRQLGKTIGYPTANIIYPLDIVEPPYGVYDVDVELDDGSLYRGLANFGISPTVSNDGIPILEVYLLDYDGNLYDKELKISFTRMIRPEIKFDNLDALKMQIEFDLHSMY